MSDSDQTAAWHPPAWAVWCRAFEQVRWAEVAASKFDSVGAELHLRLLGRMEAFRGLYPHHADALTVGQRLATTIRGTIISMRNDLPPTVHTRDVQAQAIVLWHLYLVEGWSTNALVERHASVVSPPLTGKALLQQIRSRMRLGANPSVKALPAIERFQERLTLALVDTASAAPFDPTSVRVSYELERLAAVHPGALQLVYLLAMCSDHPIQVSLLQAGWSMAPLPLREEFRTAQGTADSWRILTQLQFIHEGDGMFLMRDVIRQAVLREMTDWERSHYSWTALEMLNVAVPDDTSRVEHWDVWESACPHVVAAAQAAGDYQSHDALASWLLNSASIYVRDRFHSRRALELAEEAVMLGERTSPHPRLADLYSNLAYCYRNAGRFDEAVATAYRAIDVTRRLRGESSELAGGYQDLGNVLRYADRFVESCAAFEEALQTISGVTDINAATVEGGIHNDMAAALLYRGKYREAVEHSYRAMELLTRRPELLTLAMQTYGQTLSRLGELHRARCVLENSVQMHKAFRVRDLRMLGRLLHALADVLEKLHDPATSVVRAEGVAYDEASGLR